jgi:O-antigen biosynthesis protein
MSEADRETVMSPPTQGSAESTSGKPLYGQAYFDHYPTTTGPVPYDRRHGEWLRFFGGIADRIASDIGPKRVLDVGCAKGFLVEALRDRGIDAFGFDASEYAIGQVRDDIRPYCWVASATEPFGEKYDLVVCIEVLEHLPEDEACRAIAHICNSAPEALFSSSPDAHDDPTHVNVRPRTYWVERFAECGFLLDAEYDVSYIAPHAMRFRRSAEAGAVLEGLLEHRERTLGVVAALRRELRTKDSAIRLAYAEHRRLEEQAARLESLVEVKDGLIARLEEQAARLESLVEVKDGLIAEKDRLLSAKDQRIDEQDRLIASLTHDLLGVQRTIGWKVLQRLRGLRDYLVPPGSRLYPAYRGGRRILEVMLDEGIGAVYWKTRYKLRLLSNGQPLRVGSADGGTPGLEPSDQYALWLRQHAPGPHDLGGMRQACRTFSYTPLVSILIPVHNTDARWLRAAIESVQAQTYEHWELCLVNDASTVLHVKPLLDEYAARDSRIRVKHLARNEGIAGATNHALALAVGEFVGLLDHDDELSPDALFEVVTHLNEDRSADLIYSDEDKLDTDGRRVEPFFKPDWNPDLLLSMNYITHFTVVRRSLLRDIGGLRGAFDGSQDYDMLLRITERTDRIIHIPKVLYHWRKAPGSAASSTAAKPFAYRAAEDALRDALQRRQRYGSVRMAQPGSYTVRYKLTNRPLVSIIIPTRDNRRLLKVCVESIRERTSYPNYELVILDNGTAASEDDSYSDARRDGLRVLRCPDPFNYSRANNTGARHARGDVLVFLNDDTQVIEPDWLTAMLEQAQRPEVGAVGAKLLYPDGRIQHAGVVLGIGGVAAHAFAGLPAEDRGYFGLADVVRNCSAVTAACMMVRRQVFEHVGGFEEQLTIGCNDVDLCLRLRARGYLVVYTPLAVLYHHESATRGSVHPTLDEERVWERWGDTIGRGDPYYNPHLTRARTDWSLAVGDRPHRDERANSAKARRATVHGGKCQPVTGAETDMAVSMQAHVFPEHRLARQLLGDLHGLEIGAGAHNPFGLLTRNVAPPEGYDFYAREQEALTGGVVAPVHIWAYADAIPVASRTEDFVISSHVVEHLPNAIGTFAEWDRVVRDAGYIFMIVPKRNALPADSQRPVTPLSHFVEDYERELTLETHPTDGVPGGRMGHYHTFTPESLLEVVEWMRVRGLCSWELVAREDTDTKVGNGFTLVFRVRHSSLGDVDLSADQRRVAERAEDEEAGHA